MIFLGVVRGMCLLTMEFFRNFLFYRITKRIKKNPVAEFYPHWEVNPGSVTFKSCMLLSELIPLSAESLSPYVVMFY